MYQIVVWELILYSDSPWLRVEYTVLIGVIICILYSLLQTFHRNSTMTIEDSHISTQVLM